MLDTILGGLMAKYLQLRIFAVAMPILLASLSLPSDLHAEDVIEKVNDECPRGYRDGPGKYCYDRNSDGSEKVIVKTGDRCPSGFRDGPGHYCYARDSGADVVVKTGDRCPRGYRDGKGHYCYRY